MEIIPIEIEGCFYVNLHILGDQRGNFVKTFHLPSLKSTPLATFKCEEEFFTVSKKNVLRGLHFQAPPAGHEKLIVCLAGSVKDFFVDLRRGSRTFKKSCLITLDSRSPRLLYLPEGIAHGFLALEENSTILYKTNCAYSPKHDMGLHWGSLNLDLGVGSSELILSERDLNFPMLDDFESPF